MLLTTEDEKDSIKEKTQYLEFLTNRRFVRFLLRRISGYCSKDKASRIEIALELISGIRENACWSCRIATKFVKGILSIGSKSFGTDLKTITEGLKDSIFRRALSSVVTGLAYFGVQKPFVPGAPFQVVWNVTRSCNLHCKHCYENAGRRGADELTTEEALSCIDNLAKAGVVFLAFSGGEPTLRPDILTLIERATSLGMYVALATNGITFANRDVLKKFKKAGAKFVQISLDGSTPEQHDKFRGLHGAFEATLKGIRNCVEEELFVEVAMTVTTDNLDQVIETNNIAQRLGANWFMIYNFVPTGRGRDIINLDLNPYERENLLKDIYKRIVTHEPDEIEILTTAPQLGRMSNNPPSDITSQPCLHESKTLPTHFFNARLPSEMQSLSDFIGGCGAGRFYVAIEPNGDIYPCVFFPHEPRVLIGNILKDDFQKLWINSDLLAELRNKDLLSGVCGTCENRYVCGGCRARAMGYFDDYLAPDPGCLNNLSYYRKLVSELENRHDLFLYYSSPPSNVGVKR